MLGMVVRRCIPIPKCARDNMALGRWTFDMLVHCRIKIEVVTQRLAAEVQR